MASAHDEAVIAESAHRFVQVLDVESAEGVDLNHGRVSCHERGQDHPVVILSSYRTYVRTAVKPRSPTGPLAV